MQRLIVILVLLEVQRVFAYCPEWEQGCFHDAGYCLSADKSISWLDAFSNCRRIGGSLVELRTEDESQYITHNIAESGKDYWIGLQRTVPCRYPCPSEDRSKNWEWVSGTSLDSTWSNWGANLIGLSDCASVTSSGLWADNYYCENRIHYICKAGPLANVPKCTTTRMTVSTTTPTPRPTTPRPTTTRPTTTRPTTTRQTTIRQTTILDCCQGNLFQRWEIKLISGGYEDVLIAINDRVDEADKEGILSSIQEYFGDLSKLMYRATRNHLYISKITVLVPQSWSGSYTAAGREAFQYANILIDEANPATGNTPYVARSLPECGKPGDYIHLTPEYLKQGFRKLYGEPGNVLLHEWAHLRWGLGDEYPHTERGEKAFYFGERPQWDFQRVTPNSDRPVLPVKCSPGVIGKTGTVDDNGNLQPGCDDDPDTGLPNDACHFIAYERQDAIISIMYDQTISQLSEFCDDEGYPASQHNADAPNEHNNLCDGKSAWAVFKTHPDFQGGARKLQSSQQLIPEFTFVQRKITGRVVLVLDVSGSMNTTDPGAGARRIERLGSDASQYINNVISDGTSVGIIKFSSGAHIVKPLTLINNARETLSNSVHLQAIGKTCIGCGILEAIRMLETKGSASGGNIVIITDGIDGSNYKFLEAQQAVETKAVVLDSILYTASADPRLISLARKSSGNVYFEDGGSTDLLQALIEVEASRNGEISEIPLQIFLDNLSIDPKVTTKVNFTIDKSVGKNTRITFTYPTSVPVGSLQFSLYSPDGSIISDAKYNTIARTISINIPGIAKSGTWTLLIANNLTLSITGQLVILSKPSNTSDSVITAQAFVSADTVDYRDKPSVFLKIVAVVKKGYNPVLGATVKAKLTAAGSGVTQEVSLYDKGIGADGIKSDGCYTGTFVSYTENGKYSVKVDVSNANGDAYVVAGGSQGVYVHPDAYDSSPAIRKRSRHQVDPFDRTTSGGFFTVQNFDGRDMFPPAQIKDLSLKLINNRDSAIQLEWTAMGEDFDQNGPATSYVLRCCQSSKLLRADFDQCIDISDVDLIAGNLSEPLEPYSRQSVIILLPVSMRNNTYYFGLKVVDDGDQWSPLSNIISANLGESTTDSKRSGFSILTLGASVGGIGMFILISLTLIVCCLLTRSKTKPSADPDAESDIEADYVNVNNTYTSD